MRVTAGPIAAPADATAPAAVCMVSVPERGDESDQTVHRLDFVGPFRLGGHASPMEARIAAFVVFVQGWFGRSWP